MDMNWKRCNKYGAQQQEDGLHSSEKDYQTKKESLYEVLDAREWLLRNPEPDDDESYKPRPTQSRLRAIGQQVTRTKGLWDL